MKKFFVVIFAVCFVSIVSVQAQNPAYKSGISFKKVWMDYQSQNGGSLSDFSSYHHGFEIAYQHRLSNSLFLSVPFKVGNVTSHDNDFELDNERCLHKSVYSIDGKLQYVFNQLNGAKVLPYVQGGLGYAIENEGVNNLQVPLGAGLHFYIRDNAWLTWSSEYRVSLEENRNNLHHGLGFTYQFNGDGDTKMKVDDKDLMDSDGDGIYDDLDLCPQEAGTAENSGCPDRDGDGIPDFKDDCPNYAGLKAFKGCPDTDGDGISDNDDECPNMVGPESNNGCPDNDTDGDGVTDDLDKCPNVFGPADNDGCPGGDKDKDGIPDSVDKCPNIFGVSSANGCPDADGDGIGDPTDACPTKAGLAIYNGCPDTDGDGLHDGVDRCPSTRGSVDNNGCPEISKSDQQVLELAMRAVQFDTGKSTLKPESYAILDQITDIMLRYPDYNLSIEGYTDNVGNANTNLALSEKRAKACYEYLISKGISVRKLNYRGFGEVNPIADNNLLSGRALNRRVEFNLSPN